MDDLISRQAAINEVQRFLGYLDQDMIDRIKIAISRLPSAEPKKACIANITLSEEQIREAIEKAKIEIIQVLPSAQQEWNNHTVACLLAELFDDTCACNYNGIDEWLPGKCELLGSCPNPVGVACWEQYLKHRAERRTDEGID